MGLYDIILIMEGFMVIKNELVFNLYYGFLICKFWLGLVYRFVVCVRGCIYIVYYVDIYKNLIFCLEKR